MEEFKSIDKVYQVPNNFKKEVVQSQLFIEDIDENSEVWLIKIPPEINPSCLSNAVVSLDGSPNIIEAGDNCVFELVASNASTKFNLVLPKKETGELYQVAHKFEGFINGTIIEKGEDICDNQNNCELEINRHKQKNNIEISHSLTNSNGSSRTEVANFNDIIRENIDSNCESVSNNVSKPKKHKKNTAEETYLSLDSNESNKLANETIIEDEDVKAGSESEINSKLKKHKKKHIKSSPSKMHHKINILSELPYTNSDTVESMQSHKKNKSSKDKTNQNAFILTTSNVNLHTDTYNENIQESELLSTQSNTLESTQSHKKNKSKSSKDKTIQNSFMLTTSNANLHTHTYNENIKESPLPSTESDTAEGTHSHKKKKSKSSKEQNDKINQNPFTLTKSNINLHNNISESELPTTHSDATESTHSHKKKKSRSSKEKKDKTSQNSFTLTTSNANLHTHTYNENIQESSLPSTESDIADSTHSHKKKKSKSSKDKINQNSVMLTTSNIDLYNSTNDEIQELNAKNDQVLKDPTKKKLKKSSKRSSEEASPSKKKKKCSNIKEDLSHDFLLSNIKQEALNNFPECYSQFK